MICFCDTLSSKPVFTGKYEANGTFRLLNAKNTVKRHKMARAQNVSLDNTGKTDLRSQNPRSA